MYEKINLYLSSCVEKDALSHAYIFYGPDEINKKNAAIKFVKKILGSETLFHPDIILISSESSPERSIHMIRNIQKFLILSPYSGRYKIVIIEDFEKLNSYSQDTLLKIFEEAPGHAIIILYSKTIDSIPATIASRGVRLAFWKQNEADLIKDKNIIDFFNGILNETSENLYYEIQNFNNYKTVEIFRLWLGFLRKRFLLNPNKKSADLLKVSQNIYFKLNETNINPKFAYDELLLHI